MKLMVRHFVLIVVGIQLGCGEQPARQGRRINERTEAPTGVDEFRWKAGRAVFEVHVDPKQATSLFMSNCSGCHKIDADDGFDVQRALEHFPEPPAERLYLHLLHEDSMVQANDPWTMEVRRKWNTNDWHHGMIGLTDAEAVQLVGWIAAGAPMK